MKKRERSLLVLSPRVRNADQARDYKPFGARSLFTILRDVAAGVSQYAARAFDEHEIFTRFFYGNEQPDEQTAEQLRRVAVSLVECGIYRSDAGAATVAMKILKEFGDDGSKWIVLACHGQCAVESGDRLMRVGDDDALFAYLWIDLCGSHFGRIGDVIARRWVD